MDLAPHYDVAILGGGPAGLAAALTIRNASDLSVLVAEAQTAGQQRIGECCPPDIVIPLARLGLVKAFRKAAHDHCPGFASSWGRRDVGYNDFIVNPLGSGWRLDRHAFDEMLAVEAGTRGVALAWGTRFQGAQAIDASHTGYRLRFAQPGNATGRTTASVVIDATGSQAVFANALGIPKVTDDKLFAKVRFARISAGELRTRQVLLEATRDGWWYAAALPGNGVVIMMVAEPDTLRRFVSHDLAKFDRSLAATLFVGPALQHLKLEHLHHRTVPIRSGMIREIEGQDWLGVGDAASSFDPITAQGVYKALEDGIRGGLKVAAKFDAGDATHADYSTYVRDRYKAYQESRNHLYRLEQRWPNAPFWRNRHAAHLNLAGFAGQSVQ